VNFVKYVENFVFVSHAQTFRDAIIVILLGACLVGCSDKVKLPSSGQLLEFEMAGPARPSVDMDRVVKARIGGGEYRVVPGDVLELTMPVILQVVTAEGGGRFEQSTPYICRVHESGTITLPIIGQLEVVGRTLSQIESDVTDAYHPEYVVTRPTIFSRVLEYKTAKVSITGAVNKPGVFSLRNDQMSLVSLLMEAEGIVGDGASVIQINHSNQDVPVGEKTTLKPLNLNRMKEVEFTSLYPGSNEVKIQLYFQQEAPSSTIGILTIRQDEKRLLTDQIDLADKGERLLLLNKLAQTEPLVSILDIEQKLNELKESLTTTFSKYDNGYKGADSNIELSNLLTASSALQENLDRPESGVSRNSLKQKLNPQAKRKLLEYRQSSSAIQQQDSLISDRDRTKTERITRQGLSQESKILVLPVKGLNIPFADVVLQDGDSVTVERLEPPLITVMGLVNRPGNFPSPPDTRYNLVQALAFAGGLNEVADPRYVTIHRLNPDGKIVSAVFPIKDGSRLADTASTLLKPGDIVDVEHTPRTRTAVFLDKVFRINIGTYMTLNDVWE